MNMSNKTNIDKVVAALIYGLFENGGATVNHEGVRVGTGLAIAANKACELVLHADEPGFRKTLRHWVEKLAPMVESNEGYRFGIWCDEATSLTYLDVSEVLLTHQLDLAIKRAKERDQIAIYHISTGTELRIK